MTGYATKFLRRSSLLISLPVLVLGIIFYPEPAHAVGSYNNAAIADKALQYVGQWGGNACNDAGRTPVNGQCRMFVNCVVWMVSGGTQNTSTGTAGYFQSFLNAGGQEITDYNALQKGDIVQKYVSSSDLHTWIIEHRDPDGYYWVVDSNSQNNNEMVRHYKRTYFTGLSSTTRAFRMGTVGGNVGSTTIGAFNPAAANFYLRNSNTPGESLPFFQFGGGNWIPLAGNWDGVGGDTIGVFNPTTATFHLRNSNSSGSADAGEIQFGAGGWVPIVGNWDGVGGDTIGVFNPATATFYLRNSNTPGDSLPPIQFGAGGWLPIVGDWDGNGTTTIGVFNPAAATFYLRNDNSPGSADAGEFQFGGGGWIPVAGNWDGVGGDSIGVFDPATSTFHLRNSNSQGSADAGVIQFGAGGWKPVVGNWDGQ